MVTPSRPDRTKTPAWNPREPHHLASRLLGHLPCTSAAPVQSQVRPGITVAPASQGTADVGKGGKSP